MPAELNILCEKKSDSLSASLDKAVKYALKEYDQMKQVGIKGELTYIYISFLLSSVLCKLPWLRIDLYDESGLNDIVECYVDWDVPNISDEFYRNISAQAKQNNIIKDYELEHVWLETADEYFLAFERVLPLIISKCTAAQNVNCEWNFGQFLGNTIIVVGVEKDEIL